MDGLTVGRGGYGEGRGGKQSKKQHNEESEAWLRENTLRVLNFGLGARTQQQVNSFNFCSRSNLPYFRTHLWKTDVHAHNLVSYRENKSYTIHPKSVLKRERENFITGTHQYSLQTRVFYIVKYLLVPQFFASLHHLSKQNLEELLIKISE